MLRHWLYALSEPVIAAIDLMALLLIAAATAYTFFAAIWLVFLVYPVIAVLDTNCDADAFRAWWGVARRDLDATKVIRWRIVARNTPQFFGGAITDHAPDVGWYR